MNTFLNGVIALIFSLVPAFGPEIITIKDDMGGVVREYNARWHQYRRSGALIRIEGGCASACARFMTLPRVCAMPNAEFFFHGLNRNGELDVARGRADSRDWETAKAFMLQEKYGAFGYAQTMTRPFKSRRVEPGVRIVYDSIWSNAPNDPPFEKYLGVKATVLIRACE